METTNPTNQEVLIRASCFLEEKQPNIGLKECQNLVRELMLFKNHWTLSQFLLNLRQVASVTFEDLEPELLRLSNFEPLQQITGVAEFLGEVFMVTKDTLIPRPETEELVLKAQSFLEQCQSGKVLEIGVGTGCIILSLERLVGRHYYMGCDISKEALIVAKKNRDKFSLQTELIYSDVYSNVPHEKFECIISNPPYIAFSEEALMDESVRLYEPIQALFAENEGLAIYEKIANRLEEFLTDSGHAFFEIGFNQGASVQRIFSEACPNRKVSIQKDIAGLDRMIIVSGKEA